MKTTKGYAFNNGRGVMYSRNPAARLALFKSLSSIGSWRGPRSDMSAWSSVLSGGFNSRNSGTQYESRTPVMVSHAGPQFRGECYADERDDVTTDHRGWFSDAECSRVLRAFVFNLPHGRFGCGYADSDSGERVYLLEVHDDAQDAANSANAEAEHYAEEEKEYSERWQAMGELKSDIAQARKEVAQEFALRNHPDFRDTIRDECRDTIDDLRDKLAELKTFSDIDE